MKVIDNLVRKTINKASNQSIENMQSSKKNDSTSFVDLSNFAKSHQKEVILKERLAEKLPWVHNCH